MGNSMKEFLLTRTSIFGNEGAMSFPGELMDRIQVWLDTPANVREFAQTAFPELSDDQREFLITGITPGEWDRLFPEGDDDN